MHNTEYVVYFTCYTHFSRQRKPGHMEYKIGHILCLSSEEINELRLAQTLQSCGRDLNAKIDETVRQMKDDLMGLKCFVCKTIVKHRHPTASEIITYLRSRKAGVYGLKVPNKVLYNLAEGIYRDYA